MNQAEWCALVHVDIGMRSGLEAIEALLVDLAEEAGNSPGTLEVVALKDVARANHFEVVGRFESEEAYLAHLVSPSNLALRRGIAAVLGSPYEDRLHAPRGAERWPAASTGDVVVVTQFEARPDRRGEALEAFDALHAVDLAAPGLVGEVALQRRGLPTNLELVSVWTSLEAFEEYLESAAAQAARAALDPLLLAPAGDRRNTVLGGSWQTD